MVNETDASEFFITTISDDPGQPPRGLYRTEGDDYTAQRVFAVLSVVAIFVLIVVMVIQPVVEKDCRLSLRKKQFGHNSGIILFILFVLSLILYSINTSVTTALLFEIENVDDDEYERLYLCIRISFEIGKWFMTLFLPYFLIF